MEPTWIEWCNKNNMPSDIFKEIQGEIQRQKDRGDKYQSVKFKQAKEIKSLKSRLIGPDERRSQTVLHEGILRSIDAKTAEYNMTLSEVIGVLELVKHDITMREVEEN